MKNINQQTLYIYWKHAWTHKIYVIGMLIFVPIAVIVHQVLPPIIIAGVFDKLANGNYTDNIWQSFGPELFWYVITVVLGGTLIWRIGVYFAWKMEMHTAKDLNQTMFDHLLSLDADFHSNSFGGSLVSRTNKFVGSFYRIYETIIFQFLTLVVMFFATVIVLWPRAPYFVIALFILSASYIFISIKATKKVRNQTSVVASKENRQTGMLADMVTNIMAVKSFSASETESSSYEAMLKDVKKSQNKLMRISLIRESIFGGVTASIQSVALILGVYAVVVQKAEVGLVFLVLSYTNNMTQRLWDFAQSGIKNLNRGLGDAEEATKTLLRSPDIKDHVKPKSKPKSYEISIENMNFSHGDNILFKDFNLKIKSGEKIGLVGYSGSGKTSLTSLLLRFKEITSGSIKIGNTRIDDLTQNDLRSLMSYVPQEPLLFHRTLAENIGYGKKDAKETEIIKASKKAYADNFIKNLDKKYHTLVGERGVKLSGGQRQRVVIARAMLKDAPILVLDEATSALDSESEKLIQEALWKLMEGRTAIVIAHRLSTVQKMDRIIVLNNGKIIEEGTHKSLLQNKNGQYSRLWEHQTGDFLNDN